METINVLRHQLIASRVAPPTGKVADAAISLWEHLASHIIPMVGEVGFNSLYERSIFLTQSTFPWLAASSLSPKIDHMVAGLKMSFEGQTPAEIIAANSLILITFTDILATLIGEQLTTRILRSAWDDDLKEGKD